VRGAYVKGADLDYNTMTEEEYNRLVENVKSSVLFATVDTCEDIVSELDGSSTFASYDTCNAIIDELY
jgi:hypothetical protein